MRYTITFLESELNDDSDYYRILDSIKSDDLQHAILIANASTRLVDSYTIQYAVVVDTEKDYEIVYESK